MDKSDRSSFITKNGKLERRDNNIVFYKYNDEGVIDSPAKPLPINAINEIYILAKVDIDTYTIAFLANNNILLHIFSPYQTFRGNFFPSTSNSVNKSGFVLLQQVRAFDDEKHRLYIAKEITRGHIINGANNVKKRQIDFEIDEILKSLNDAKTINEIMLIEAGFKKKYYKHWNKIIKNQRVFKFTSRTKRPPADKINSFISYINTRMYNVVLSEIYKTELDPRIGFLHEPNYKTLSLHLDIAEIFKPIIGDNLIFEMLNKKEILPKDFKTDSGRFRFTNQAIQKIELKMINTLTKQISLGEQKLTWRQIIRKEVNKIKKTVCEYSEYHPFIHQ